MAWCWNLKDRCEQCERTLLPTTYHSCNRMISYSLASLICKGCGLQDRRTVRKLKPVLYNAMGRKGRYSYMWNSVVWPPRSITLAQKRSQKQTHSLYKLLYTCSCSVLVHTLWTWPLHTWWLWPCNRAMRYIALQKPQTLTTYSMIHEQSYGN